MDTANRLLLACLGPAAPEALLARLQNFAAADWEGLVQAALGYKLAPQLQHRLKGFFAAGAVPPVVQQRLREAYYLSAGRNMRIYRDLGQLLGCFNAAGVPVILLKGAHLAEIVYGNVALRPMGDVDLLVRQADLLRAHEVLATQGYVCAEKNMGNALGHLPPYEKKNSATVEIHYNIFNPPFHRHGAVEELWERARPAAIQGIAALTLCPEDLLLHLCAHAAMDHGFEIGPLPFFDITRTIEHYHGDIDWERLLQRARQWGLYRCLLLMLCLSKKMAGLALPVQLPAAGMPDAPSDRELAAAQELVFEGGTPVASDIARLFGSESLSAKLGYCLRQIFPSGQTMRVVHPRSRGRLSLGVQYFFRIKGLFRRQGKIAWRLLLRDKEMVGFAKIEKRRNTLKDWIAEKG